MSSYLWFWTFWHWSTESFRIGALLRSPLTGIGGHWDEWYRHEANDEERAAIAKCGRRTGTQRDFVRWLARHWVREASAAGARPSARFVLGQLSRIAPFDTWNELARYRTSYGRASVSAVVLAEESRGEPSDVRRVEALLLATRDPTTDVVAEGFHGDAAQLRTALHATKSVLEGRGLTRMLATWLLAGRRPYPRWLALSLTLGWLATALLILWIRFGPDPGRALRVHIATLALLWLLLTIVGLSTASVMLVTAILDGRHDARRLARHQVWLRMDGALTLIGGSAGLPFALNTLAALARGAGLGRRGWLWREVMRALREANGRWAATGTLHDDGRVSAVVLAPKLRACRLHPHVEHLITPHQLTSPSGDGRDEPHAVAQAPAKMAGQGLAAVRLGFAAELPTLHAYRCRHLADALLAMGALTNRSALASNVLALGVCAAMLGTIPNVLRVIAPPPAPILAGPAAASPYQLQLNLRTDHPSHFAVVLESAFWANRRARVERSSVADASAVADLELTRLANQVTRDVEDGVVYVERRHRFLGREFAEGERVGRYSLAYLVQSHE